MKGYSVKINRRKSEMSKVVARIHTDKLNKLNKLRLLWSGVAGETESDIDMRSVEDRLTAKKKAWERMRKVGVAV